MSSVLLHDVVSLTKVVASLSGQIHDIDCDSVTSGGYCIACINQQ